MTIYYLFFVLFVSSINGAIQHDSSSHIDGIIHEIKEELHSAEDLPCLEKTVLLLENVKNYTLWATWVWNANLLPSGNMYGEWTQLGHYDQCLNPPWLSTHPQFRSQYCIADVRMTNVIKPLDKFDPYGSTEDYLNSPSKLEYPLNRIYWGVCMPAACKPASIAKILRVMYQSTSFSSTAPNITVKDCQIAGAKTHYSLGFYMFIALIITLVTLVAASTYYRKNVVSNEDPDSLDTLVAKSFCLVKNCQDLVKVNKQEIKVINGMRFITAMSIVLIHEIFYLMLSGMSNVLTYEKILDGPIGVLLHLDILVDTFLAMSGLLHIKGLLAYPERQKNLFLVLWKRYLRLIGPFAMTIFFQTAVFIYIGSGPLWLMNGKIETEVCAKTWRLSLMMLNTNPNEICHAVTWYLSCDYQLTILGTVLFYFYQKDKKLGFTAFGTAAVISFIIPGALTYWYQLPTVHFLDMGKILNNVRELSDVGYTYTSSHSRAGPYLVGIAMGYIMTMYNPADYRKTISKKWSIIGTALSLLVMVCMLAFGQFFLKREYSVLEHVVATITNRVGWAVAIACIIGLCEYGTVPLVSKFLGLKVFTPLSRLSYGIYVIHTIIIQRRQGVSRSPQLFDVFNVALNTIGTLSVSIVLSFVMWVLVEAPAISLSNNLLFNNRSKTAANKEPEKNEKVKENGTLKTKAL
ncbi:unnamed protein product [Chrysodeixis includens]|uniref:Nose resistant to fluoxetine protein 6-like n=1 Tax=Chrysodeixis includens TaxID=689277 RepID=A0A9P0BQC3_CHRIL|nr:unnamed protein product [Chrysodeixis includens]